MSFPLGDYQSFRQASVNYDNQSDDEAVERRNRDAENPYCGACEKNRKCHKNPSEIINGIPVCYQD